MDTETCNAAGNGNVTCNRPKDHEGEHQIVNGEGRVVEAWTLG